MMAECYFACRNCGPQDDPLGDSHGCCPICGSPLELALRGSAHHDGRCERPVNVLGDWTDISVEPLEEWEA